LSSGSDDLHAKLVVALEELEQLAGDAALDVAPGRAAAAYAWVSGALLHVL
jgi:hypothetical protein